MKKILTFALLASMLLTLPAVAKDDKKDNKRKSYNMNDYNTSKNPRSIKEDLIEFLKPGEVYSPTPNFSAPKKAEEAAAEADANADKSKDSAAGAVLNDLSTVQNTTLTDAEKAFITIDAFENDDKKDVLLFSFKRENASSPVFAFEYTLTADQKSINELLGKGEVVTEAKFNAYASAPVCKVVLKSNDVNTYFIRTDLVFGESYGIFYINANEYNRLVLAAMPAFPAVEKIKDCTVGTVNPPVVTEKKEDKKDQEVSSSNASTSQSQSSSGPGWSSSSSSSSSSSEEADANVFFFGTQPKKQKVEVEKTEDGYRMQIPNNNNSQSSSKLELIEL